ncbi:MAG TPA: ABC transporter substrate-binding protein, partial [Candidatus Saccharimonadales bacterium]|nr:ABC transporter substrate-binding protein [Candidatus Saccharimonadales bacterium]
KDEKTIIPDLADSWDVSPDAKTYTFHLHPGVTWQDGTPFTAQDVIFTITQSFKYKFRYTNAEWEEIQGADAVKAGTATTLSGLTAPDANTIKITLSNPNSIYLTQITEPEDVILPQHLLQNVDPAGIEKSAFAQTAPVGTGPYKFIKYVTGQEVDFVANPTYFKGVPQIQNLFMLRTPANAAVAQAASGGLDLVIRASPADYQAASQIAGDNVISIPGVGQTSGQFNLALVPSVQLRQAIYYAIDRKGIVSSIFNGLARVLEVAPGFTEYPDLNPYAYDPAKAKQLLAASGWDVTKPFRIIYDQTYPSVADYMPVIQQDLQAIGMNVELDPLDSTTFINRSENQRTTWEMAMENGGNEGISPANSASYYDCTRPTFESGYANCQVDQWFKDALQTSDATKQDGFYHQIALALNTDLPNLSFWSPDSINIASKKLGGGFAIYPDPKDSFFTVSTWTFGP